MSSRRETAVIALVRWARERVPLYRELYKGVPPVERWADFRRLPVLTTARLRATPLCEQVDALDDVLRSQTAYALQSVVTPRTLVLDEDDTDAAFDQTRAAFALAGVRKGMRVALVAPPWQRYFAAEVTDQLGYFGVESHLVIAHETAAVARALTALAPQRAIAVDGTPAVGSVGWVTMRRPEGDGPDLYVVPEVRIAAVRREGDRFYRVLSPYCLLESNAAGRLLLTALLRYHQPLVRYELPDRGRLERGRLVLEEVAP